MYEHKLAACGIEIISLKTNESFPDGCFVEDTAIVLDELAIITTMGAESRRGEPAAIAEEVSKYRETIHLEHPVEIDGGDVLRIGRRLYVGLSERTNEQAITELNRIFNPLNYKIFPVEVLGGLHLKTACTALDEETLLINTDWVDIDGLGDFRLLKVAEGEATAANTIRLGEKIFMQAGSPRTTEIVEKNNYQTVVVDISEFIKANAGLSCLSIIFEQDI